ncbi:hypothetical protein AU255_07425 [Methyloprofundus sedimenti]|uniref:Uncharacterized protein n=1 Tax=Methyloprofundus sedimenti TaxID=1420851 RepID=A0A1V8M815_9GAMM|nr:hypothetical protein AU255_07425 [Methyloprofundus sedimenti]
MFILEPGGKQGADKWIRNLYFLFCYPKPTLIVFIAENQVRQSLKMGSVYLCSIDLYIIEILFGRKK